MKSRRRRKSASPTGSAKEPPATDQRPARPSPQLNLSELYQADLPLCLKTYMPDGTITAVSRGLASVFGYEAHELLGRNVSELTEDQTPETWRAYLETIADKSKVDVEFRGRRKHGQLFLGRATICPLRREGELVGFFSICHEIGEEKRLERAVEKQARELEAAYQKLWTLHSISQQISASVNWLETLDAIVQNGLRILDASHCFVVLHDPLRNAMQCVAASGLDPSAWQDLSMRMDEEEGVVRAFRDCEAVVVPDADAAPWLRKEWKERFGYKAIVFLPMIAKGGAIGVLILDDTRGPRQFDAWEITAAQSVADQAAVALQNARLFSELDTRLKEATALARVGRALTQEMELDRLLNLILDSLQETFHVHSSGILFLDESTNELYIRVARGYELLNGEKLRIKVGSEGITGHAARLHQALYVPDVTLDPRYIPGSAGTRSELAIPLRVGDRLLGVLDVQDAAPHAFSPATVRVLTQFADQAAIAIQNARLFQQVARAEREWIITFDSASEAISLHDPDYRIIRANRAFAEQVGLPFREIIGRKCFELLHSAHCPGRPCFHEEALADGRGRTQEVTDAQGRAFQVSISPLLDEQGRMLGTVHVSRNVSSEKLLQQTMLQTEKLAALGRMIAGVAHELNNPLTVLRGFAQLLLGRQDLPSELRPNLERMEREAERASHIVQNLLRFARHEKPQRQPVDINRLLGDALGLREYDLRLNNIALEKQLAADLPSTAGDPMLLQQVFLNIISNAYDAMKEAAGRGTLRVSTRMDGDRIRIDFEDDGPGIKDPDKIFEPFYTTKPVGTGTGLGLSICYGVVQEHGGEIKARKRRRGGAQFTIWLPSSTAEPSVAATESVSGEAQPRGRVLIVDDEEGVLDVQKQVLEQMGVAVLAAGSADEALEILGREKPRAAVLDLKMPGKMGGPQLYRWIQDNRPELARRVLFVTGDVIGGETRAFLEQVGNPYLPKPFDLRDYRNAIRALLGSGD